MDFFKQEALGLAYWAWFAIALAVAIVLIVIIIIACKVSSKPKKDSNEPVLMTEEKPAEKESKQEEAKKEAAPVEEKKAEKSATAKTAEKKEPTTAKTTTKTTTAKSTAAKTTAKKEEKPAEKDSGSTETKVYHISKRKEDKKWQVKAEGADKALRLFFTQTDAIEYAKKVAGNQEGRIVIHKEGGGFRKLNY